MHFKYHTKGGHISIIAMIYSAYSLRNDLDVSFISFKIVNLLITSNTFIMKQF